MRLSVWAPFISGSFPRSTHTEASGASRTAPPAGSPEEGGLSRSVRPAQAQFVDSKLELGGVMELLFMGFFVVVVFFATTERLFFLSF